MSNCNADLPPAFLALPPAVQEAMASCLAAVIGETLDRLASEANDAPPAEREEKTDIDIELCVP
jgi:hypothetical protein